MTPAQTFTIAALGGIAGVLGLILGLGLSVALALLGLHIWDRIKEIPEAWRNRQEQRRTRRADVDTCKAIAALSGIKDPKGGNR